MNQLRVEGCISDYWEYVGMIKFALQEPITRYGKPATQTHYCYASGEDKCEAIKYAGLGAVVNISGEQRIDCDGVVIREVHVNVSDFTVKSVVRNDERIAYDEFIKQERERIDESVRSKYDTSG
jgi:hypothetical protein